jgi:hypothetical protein
MANRTKEWHGTSGGYTNHGCRCPRCRQAWAEAISLSKERRWARMALGANNTNRTNARTEPVAHGTNATYGNWKCRCRHCTAAHATYERERRRGVA